MDEHEIILGLFPYDFMNDKNMHITGVTAFVGAKDTQRGVGYRCDKKSFTEEEFAAVFTDINTAQKILMKPVSISYTRRGKIRSIELISQK